MAATTQDRNTILKEGALMEPPVLQATRIPAGVMVQVDATGHAVNASATRANRTIGISRDAADNATGASGAIRVSTRRNIAGTFGNSAAGDAIAIADVGNDCFVVDNQTVARTDGAGARPKAGRILDVNAAGVVVWFA